MKEPSKPYRRRRRYQGATWAPPSASAEVTDGLWCRGCRKRHGYMSMGLKHEKRGDTFYQLWSCPKTHDVIGEVNLGEVKAQANAALRTPEGEPGRTDEGLAAQRERVAEDEL